MNQNHSRFELFAVLAMLIFALTHSLKAADTTNEVKLAVGKTYSVDLDSNPSTGYHWKLISPTNQVVLQVASTYESMEPNGPPGTGGSEHWTFKALEKGSVEIVLEYARPWEKEAIDRKYLIIVCE